jgi:hypothetical protein
MIWSPNARFLRYLFHHVVPKGMPGAILNANIILNLTSIQEGVLKFD